MASSPTSRTLKWLRDEGYLVAITEKWNPHARIRQDLFGICDLVAIKEKETVCVQATSGSNVSARVKKIKDSEAYPMLNKANWSVWVVGWKKYKVKRGGKAVRWDYILKEL